MAGEFGVSTEEVINLLRQMDVPVRSHLTLLTDDQVSRVRARWEREKRVIAQRQAAAAQPAAGSARRRKVAAPEPAAPAPAPVAASAEGATGIRRRARAAVDALAELVGVRGNGDESASAIADYDAPEAPAAPEPVVETPAPRAPRPERVEVAPAAE